MSRLLFFSRVAFLCNICFLATFIIRFVPALKEAFFVSTIVIIGLVMSIVINVMVNLFCLLMVMTRKPLRRYVPMWMMITNFLFFVFQVILLIK
jgi:hypothetical protein